jgi:hypothetical protein
MGARGHKNWRPLVDSSMRSGVTEVIDFDVTANCRCLLAAINVGDIVGHDRVSSGSFLTY